MGHKVNLAVQILPLYKNQEEAYGVIDKAIEKVQQSGLHHVVCPFETVIEGEYGEVIKLVGDMQQACYDAGATDLLVNMKLHRSTRKDMAIEDKTGKYQ